MARIGVGVYRQGPLYSGSGVSSGIGQHTELV